MAFSTQRGFFPLAYMSEPPQAKCVTKLKTYSSSTDHRSWSADKSKQSQFLLDLVACRMPPSESHARPPCSGRCEDNTHQSSHLVGGDSLLNATVDELTRLERLLLEKDDLKCQLEVSQEKLRVLNEEHRTVNAIMTDEHHPEVASMLQRKVEQLKSANKLDKGDENELAKLLDAFIKRERSTRVLEAQNCYLRRLIEKLSTRCRLEAIRLEPEQSTDISYLQSQVDSLRKEVCLLRELEDKHLKTETASRGIQGPCEDSGLDSENVNIIVAERNALREKCKNFAAMTDRIYQWKQKAEQFETFRAEACNALKEKDHDIRLYREDIETLQSEIKKMEMCCRMKEQEEDNLCSSVNCLVDENRKLQQNCDVEIRKVRKLQDQIQCLTKELCDKNCVIDQYDMQFKHVLGVVENLQRKDTVNIVGLQDVHSQTPTEIEELAATTRITLDHIHKELENRNVVECEMARSHEELLEAKMNLARSAEHLAKTEEDLDLANCEMKLLKKEKELQEALLLANNADCMKSIGELKAKLDQAEQENKLKLDEMEEANKRQLDQMQADMERERQAFANEREDFERQKQSWYKEKQSLMADCGEGDRLRAELEKERQAWCDERSDFCKEKNNWEKERQSCAKLNADLSRERAEMERIKQDFDKARLAFDKERQDMQREREGFANERNQFEQSCESVEKLKQRMEKEKQDLEEKAKHLADTLSKNEQRRLGSDTEMVNLRNQNDELNRALKEAQNKNDGLNKQLKDCQNEMQAQKEKMSKLNSELNSSQGQLKEADGLVKDISSVRDRNEQLSTVVKAADMDCQKLLAEERRKNADLQKQLATANTAANERKLLEKEIEGHRTSNKALLNSVSKLTSKINTRSAADFERELILLLDNFTDEICRWRCEKNCKRLSKIQEIAKKICDYGLDCLTLKELVYMHQQMCEFARKLEPAPCEGEQRRKARRCCKCTGEICTAPTIPSEHDLVLREKLETLERDMQDAKENLRKLKKQQVPIDLDEDQELETMRASTYRLNRGPRHLPAMSRARFNGSIREEYDEAPTKDRSGL